MNQGGQPDRANWAFPNDFAGHYFANLASGARRAASPAQCDGERTRPACGGASPTTLDASEQAPIGDVVQHCSDGAAPVGTRGARAPFCAEGHGRQRLRESCVLWLQGGLAQNVRRHNAPRRRAGSDPERRQLRERASAEVSSPIPQICPARSNVSSGPGLRPSTPSE